MTILMLLMMMEIILFGVMFYIPVNTYGHVEMVSLPNH